MKELLRGWGAGKVQALWKLRKTPWQWSGRKWGLSSTKLNSSSNMNELGGEVFP